MKTVLWIVCGVLLAGGLGGCTAGMSAHEGVAVQTSHDHADLGRAGAPEAGVQLRSAFFSLDDALPPDPSDTSMVEEPGPTRMLIHTGQLDLAVSDRVQAGKAAAAMTESLGGYVQQLSDEYVVLRIPVDRWEDALAKAAEIGRVVRRQLEAQDVTEEFLDVELQLKNLRTLSDRLSELLTRAETVEAALKVEKELARVRSDIERLEGRMKYLRNQIAFATLTLQFMQVSEARPFSTRLPFYWLEELGVERLLGLPGGGP